MNQSNAKSVAISTSGTGVQTGSLTYEDTDGNQVTATSADPKIVEELKYIRKQWAADKSVDFEFEVEVAVISSLKVGASKPSGS